MAIFKNKRLKEIEEIKHQRELLEKEKQELLKIKEMMENTNNPNVVDISNIYVWEVNGIKNIVRLEVNNITGTTLASRGRTVSGYESKLIDIFTEKELYREASIDKMERKVLLQYNPREESLYGYLYPIYEEDRSLLEYPNKKVPKYVMYQTFYKINNINISDSKEEQKVLERK